MKTIIKKVFAPSVYQQWWDSLPESTREYLKRQPVWHDRDLYKFGAVCAVIGFAVGFLAGYEAAWRPVVTTFRPLIG